MMPLKGESGETPELSRNGELPLQQSPIPKKPHAPWVLMFFNFLLFAALIPPATAQNSEAYQAPKQYIFADRDDGDFSNRTSSAPFTEITPHPLVMTNSAFENIFFANSSIQARSQGSPTISLRGSNQAARVLFVLDEVPLNFADGFGGSTLLVPLELTKSIQVVEGPTSSLYGANAMAGAIHFRTEKLSRPRLRVGMGDSDAKLGIPLTTKNISLVTPYDFNLRHSLQGSVFLEKDRGDFHHTTDGYTDLRKDNGQNLRRFTLGSRHDFGNLKIKSLTLYTGLNKETPGPLHTPLVTSQKSDVFFASLAAHHKTDSTASHSVLSVSRFRSQYFDFGNNHSNSDKLFASEIYVARVSETLLSQTLLDFNWNRYQSSYTGEETFDRIEPEIAQTLIYQATPSLTIEPTLRYLTRYEQLLGQLHVPYRVGAARLWMSVGQGFRPPSLTDLYAENIYFIGNRDLLPEKSLQSEVGLGWDLPFTSLSVSLFQTRYTNLFQSLPVSPGVTTKTNIGEAQTLGMTMGGNFQLHPRWQLRLNHTLMSAREKTQQTPLPFSPDNQSFASLSYSHKDWSLTAQQTVWSSFYDTDFNSGQVVRMSSWQGTDFLVSRRLHQELSIGIGVFNVFDHPRQLTFDFPEPQRRFFLNLEMQL